MANYTQATGIVLPLEDLLQSVDGAAYIRTRNGLDLQTYLDTLSKAIGGGVDFELPPNTTTIAGVSVNNWNTYTTGVEGALDTALQIKLDDVNNRLHVRVASFKTSGTLLQPEFYIEVVNADITSVTPGPYASPLAYSASFNFTPDFTNRWGERGAYLQFSSPYMDSREYVFNLSKLDSSVLIRLFVESIGVDDAPGAFISLGDEVVAINPDPPLNVLFNTTDAQALSVEWNQITGDGKPEDFATKGATWGVNIYGDDLPASGATVNHTFVQSTIPSDNVVNGDIWINTGDGNKLHVYQYPTGWIERRDDGIASALLLAQQALDATANSIATFYQATPPVDDGETVLLGDGDLWVDTSDGNHIHIYQGGLWISILDSRIQEALDKASEALDKVDGKSSAYRTAYDPRIVYALQEGDIWADPNTDQLKMWSEDNSVWIQVSNNFTKLSDFEDDTDLSLTADWDRITGPLKPQDQATRNLIFIQGTIPSPSTNPLQVGDLWIDTDGGNRFHAWDGSYWISAEDTRLDDIVSALDEHRVDIDRKTTVFAQNVTPTPPAPEGHTEGDVWVHTGEGNKVYIWSDPGSGYTWVDRQDVALTTVVADVDGLLSDSMQSLLDNADTHSRVVTAESTLAGITAAPIVDGASTDAKLTSLIAALAAVGLITDQTT